MAKTTVRHGHLAPLLAQLQERAGLTGLALADAAGVAPSDLSARLRRPDYMSTERVLRIAEACGATPEELELVRDLDALDRGVLPLPEGATPEDVRRARVALGGAWEPAGKVGVWVRRGGEVDGGGGGADGGPGISAEPIVYPWPTGGDVVARMRGVRDLLNAVARLGEVDAEYSALMTKIEAAPPGAKESLAKVMGGKIKKLLDRREEAEAEVMLAANGVADELARGCGVGDGGES